jgi:hypothetical protein
VIVMVVLAGYLLTRRADIFDAGARTARDMLDSAKITVLRANDPLGPGNSPARQRS